MKVMTYCTLIKSAKIYPKLRNTVYTSNHTSILYGAVKGNDIGMSVFGEEFYDQEYQSDIAYDTWKRP